MIFSEKIIVYVMLVKYTQAQNNNEIICNEVLK